MVRGKGNGREEGVKARGDGGNASEMRSGKGRDEK